MNDQQQNKAILWYLKVAGDALKIGDNKFARQAAERATAALGGEVLPRVPAAVPQADPRQTGLPLEKVTPQQEQPTRGEPFAGTVTVAWNVPAVPNSVDHFAGPAVASSA